MIIERDRASKATQPPERRDGGNRRTLVLALALIGLLFLAQGAVIRHLAHSVEERSWQLERDSIASVELLARIARDLERERILVDDHIATSDRSEMAEIEQAREAVVADLVRSQQEYAPLIELPNEESGWRDVSARIERWQETLTRVIALSRADKDDAARAAWSEMRREYELLHEGVSGLIELNRAGALASVSRNQKAERVAEEVGDGVLLLALLGMAWTGLWASRRITSYERRLEQYADELQSQNRELDAFAGRVAHDLRNALTPLAIAPCALRRTAGDPAKVVELADRVERCSERAERLIEALLTFARASQDAGPDEAASVRDVVKDVLEQVAPAAAEHDVTIEVSPMPELRVRCDAALLHIVLANLVGNAVKYLQGASERYVRISARSEGAACRIDVDDTGPGIPEHARARIFDPFFRVEGSRAAGFGIGLATVRRIIEARGGRVAVESATGAGSRFHVWLHRAPLESAAPLVGPRLKAATTVPH